MSARRLPSGGFVLHSIQLGLAGIVAIAAVWGFLGGCREQSTAPIDRNRAPETFLTSAPGDSQTTFYRVGMRWWGADHDGAVVGFDVAVTESLPNLDQIAWKRTLRSDSIIIFPVEETREVLGHRFYVRAIDNEGKVDETPAWVFFGARNNVPPEVTFLESVAYSPGGQERTILSTDPDFPTDTIPTGWGVRFRWSGTDGDVAIGPDGSVIQVGRVDKFFYRLLPIESEFLGGSLIDTAAAYDGEYFERFPRGSVYAFNARAIDDGGLSGSGTVTRSFVWNQDPVSRITRCERPDGSGFAPCFRMRGQTYFSGDTLPLPSPKAGVDSFPSPEFTAEAFDPDPLTGDNSVASIEWRYSAGAIFTAWSQFTAGSYVRLPGLRTGDYVAMVRSIDQLDRVEGTPDTLLFYVNFPPRFITQTEDGSFTQSPLPGDTFRLSELATGLPCKFMIDNPDEGISERVRWGYRFEGVENEFGFRYSEAVPGAVPYEFRALPLSGRFRLGANVIRIRVEDNRHSGGADRGTRSAERPVHFQVVAG